jgi:tetratricopeptide (TPR) repeat protein
MRSVHPLVAVFAVAISAAGCTTSTRVGTETATAPAPATATVPAAEPAPAPTVAVIAPATMAITLTTESAIARDEFLRGVRIGEVEQNEAARAHFDRAIAADPNFALARLYAAYYAPSVAIRRAHLDEAVRLADRASPAEQLWIRANVAGLNNDVTGQLAILQELVKLTPNDPRAYGYLAGVQFNAGQRAEARATLERAGQIDPNFSGTWIQIGNSYMQSEPRDLEKAEAFIRKAVTLEPNEPFVHDYMGDLYRAVNKLPEARASYTRMIELDPSRAGAYQQRGHVNSFLGNFAEARADYDRAIALADPVNKPSFAAYRALVSVYEGNPGAAETELGQVAASVDALNIPNAVGSKIFAFSEQALIAIHNKHFDVAQRAVDQLRDLYRQQAAMGGTDALKRSTEANIAFWEGFLAARRGDFATARTKAKEMMTHRAPDRSPRKDESAHELLGMADLFEGKHASAVTHFSEANPDDIYVIYNLALALEGAGRTEEAKLLFRRVAGENFNGAATSLVKAEAAKKAL